MNTQPINRRTVVLGVAGAWALPLLGCGGGGDGNAAVPTALFPAEQPFKPLAALGNTNSVHGQFSAVLTARPASVQLAAQGPATTVWAYNGVCPGPLIDVKEGDTVSILFQNQLAQESTIHWHGLPIPPDQDGNPMEPVAAGGSKTYTFTLPLGSAGTYWYHPHPHMTTHQQVYMGLAGCFVVRPAVDPLAGFTERLMVVTDLRLDSSNQIAANTNMDMMNGREGNQLLVNGVSQPVLRVQPGATERWRVVNATNARYLRLALQGHAFNVVGLDGGLFETPQTATETLLAPGQRVELLVQTSPSANQRYVLQALAYDRGAMMSAVPTDLDLLILSTSLEGRATPMTLQTALRPVAGLVNPVRTQAVVLSEVMGMGNMGNQFLINSKSFDPARVDMVSRLNDVEDWTIDNQGDMDHPFHIHGNQFQLVSRTRSGMTTSSAYPAWTDTVNVRSKETVRIRVQQTMLGKRMFHCHILEHEDQGMMGILDVQP